MWILYFKHLYLSFLGKKRGIRNFYFECPAFKIEIYYFLLTAKNI